jgi:hypothetical protein
LDDIVKRLKSAPDDDIRDEYLAIDDWLHELQAVPTNHFARMAETLPGIKSRIEVLIALAEGSSDSEADVPSIKVKRRSAVAPEPPINVDEEHKEDEEDVANEGEVENEPPVSNIILITARCLTDSRQCFNCKKRKCYRLATQPVRSRCLRCVAQKKGCSLLQIVDDPPVPSSAAAPAPSPDVEVVESRRPKRRKLQPAAPSTPSPTKPTQRPEVVIPIKRRSSRPTIAATPPPPSPAFSFANLEPSSAAPSTSQLAPYSTLGASRSVPDFSTSRLQLENGILRSQLAATRRRLEQEQDRARQELQSQQEQFAAERQAYIDYIDRLRGDGNVE